MSFIFMHFFVAILNNSFEDIKSNTDEQSKEFEMADFIVERMCDMLGISKQGNDAGHNASVREDDTASTNSQYNFDFPPRETSEESGSKLNENLSAKVKQTAVKKSPSQHLATKLELERPISPKSWKRTPETHLDSLLEQLFERIGVVAGDLAMEDEQQDAKLLNVISQIPRNNHEIPCQRTSSKRHQLEESSSVTTTWRHNTEYNRSSESKNSSEDEIMKFIRRRSTRELPIHLKVGSFYHQPQNNRTGGK